MYSLVRTDKSIAGWGRWISLNMFTAVNFSCFSFVVLLLQPSSVTNTLFYRDQASDKAHKQYSVLGTLGSYLGLFCICVAKHVQYWRTLLAWGELWEGYSGWEPSRYRKGSSRRATPQTLSATFAPQQMRIKKGGGKSKSKHDSWIAASTQAATICIWEWH